MGFIITEHNQDGAFKDEKPLNNVYRLLTEQLFDEFP